MEGGGHLMWAQKKEGVSDSQGCPGVVVSTLSPKVCKLRTESRRGNPTLVGLWLLRPFLLWGAIGKRRGRVVEKYVRSPQCVLGSTIAVLGTSQAH